jgi:uncharacterized protein YndB with AHSA1/START domain
MTEDLTAIRVDEFLPYPPARVWRALTTSDMIAKWLMPNDFQPVVGHRFTFTTQAIPAADFDGVVNCEVLAIEPEELLRISWAGGTLDTTVTWRLVPEGRGTRLFLEHEGFDPDDETDQFARKSMGGGWRSHMVRQITKVLAEEDMSVG